MVDSLTYSLIRPDALARWVGLKGSTFWMRPYKTPRIISTQPILISLLYTMTPILPYTFQLVNSFQNFFLFFKPTFG